MLWHKLLDDKRVLRAVRLELLRGGCPVQIVDDKARDVVVEVYEYLTDEDEKGKPPVEDVDRMLAIVRPRAYQRGIDALRGRYSADEVFAGSTEDHQDQAAPSSLEDQLETRQAAADIRAHQSPKEAAITEGLVAGLTHKEIATEQKVSHGHVRNVVSSLDERHRPRLRSAGFMLVGVALGAIAVALLNRPSEHGGPDVANPVPSDSVEHPPPPKPPLTPDQRKLVADLRALGHAKAQEKDWQTCWTAYFAAENIDDHTPQDALHEATTCKEQLDKAQGKQP